MKTKILLVLTLLSMSKMFCQLKGSGVIVSKSYDYAQFDKLSLSDLDGQIAIEVGKPWSVRVEVDDNLLDLLQFNLNETEHLLKISFQGNANNKLYIEKTQLKITIAMPEASLIKNDGNSNVSINNLIGRYCKLENLANGNMTASGKVDMVDIIKSGNGDLRAEKLSCKKADVQSSGNGDVYVNANERLKASGSGNGDIVNTGSADFSKSSVKSGNGKLRKS